MDLPTWPLPIDPVVLGEVRERSALQQVPGREEGGTAVYSGTPSGDDTD